MVTPFNRRALARADSTAEFTGRQRDPGSRLAFKLFIRHKMFVPNCVKNAAALMCCRHSTNDGQSGIELVVIQLQRFHCTGDLDRLSLQSDAARERL
jgi:hypothetical protein